MLAAALAVATLAVTPAFAGSHGRAAGVQRATALETQVLARVNAVRARSGLGPLRQSGQLAAAAAQHSTQMARMGYFSHNSANGAGMAGRVRGYYPLGGHRYWAVGENLLWAAPSVGSTGAVDLWMGSAGHRANLLSRQWREIGIAAVHAVSAPGVYGGREVTIVTADFGVRR
jgi:uncharacterized protein YkwD